MSAINALELIKNIKAKTALTVELAITEQAEECSLVLNERQQLLEQLFNSFQQELENNASFKQQVIELCQWIQEQDSPAITNISKQKKALQSKFIKQNRNKHAIAMYSQNRVD